MTCSSRLPEWAQTFAKEAIDHVNSIGTHCDYPPIKWTTKRRVSSSGYCYLDHISIVAGSDLTDAKMVILHELAHWTMHNKKRQGHSDLFWRRVWYLYRWARLPMEHCVQREAGYKKRSVHNLFISGVPTR